MSWNPIEEPTDFAVVAGQRTPGLCDVKKAGSPRRWDKRRGYGLSGSTLVYRGTDLGEFSLCLRLYTVDDWNAWHAFKGVVRRPEAGRRATALDIVHPQLAEVDITSAVVLDVLAPVQTSPEGEWTIEIPMQEFRRPVVTVAPVAASSPRTENNADLALEREIDRVAGEFAAEARAGGLIQ